MTTFVEKIASTEEGKRGLNQERAILELTELICEIMEEENVTRADLARRLGRSKGFVTQLLDGRANMTIRTIADIFTALGRTIHFHGVRPAARVSDPAVPPTAGLDAPATRHRAPKLRSPAVSPTGTPIQGQDVPCPGRS